MVLAHKPEAPRSPESGIIPPVPGVRRVHGAGEVQEAEQREISWWFKIKVAGSAIATAVLLLPVAAWGLMDGGPSWLWLVAAAAPLLALYGIWDLKRLGPGQASARPMSRSAYETISHRGRLAGYRHHLGAGTTASR